jgi:PAS domain-containing protein
MGRVTVAPVKKAATSLVPANISRLFGVRTDSEKRRLRSHAGAVLLVCGVMALKVLIGATDGNESFALLYAAVAVAALAGGVASAFVATLLAILAARLLSNVALPVSIVFGVEAMLVAAVVLHLRSRSQQLRESLATADAEGRDFRATVRQGRIVNEVFDDLQRASPRHAAFSVSSDGVVNDWPFGAAALYWGDAQQVVGKSAGLLFHTELPSAEFKSLIGRARANGALTTWRGPHRRFDGTIFDAAVQLRFLPETGVFSMLVHDLTESQAAEALSRDAAERQQALREELALAQEQLASLELVTDPRLNAMPGKDALTTLLDRLRTAVRADAIAIVRPSGFRPRLICGSDGLRPEPGSAIASGRSEARTLMIHNDAARVSEMSLVHWPERVCSMISVPMLQSGQTHATMEVVYQRGPRSTHLEIALIQVAAARAANLLSDESYATGTASVA